MIPILSRDISKFFNSRKMGEKCITYMKSKEFKNFDLTTIQPNEAIPANNFKQINIE